MFQNSLFWYRKISSMRKGVSRFFIEKFQPQCTEEFRRGTPNMFQKISGIEKSMNERGVSRFSIEIFLSHSTANSCSESLQCFRNGEVPKNFMDKRGGVTIFRRKYFVSQLQNFSWRDSSVFQNISGFEIFFAYEGDHGFLWNVFLSHSVEKFRKGYLVFQNYSDTKHFFHMREYHDFFKILFHSTNKLRK